MMKALETRRGSYCPSLSHGPAWAPFQRAPLRPPESAKIHRQNQDFGAEMSDADFTKAAAEGGVAEVKFGELAEDKASSKAVKDFGQRMVEDHTKADDKLKTAASKENISIPG